MVVVMLLAVALGAISGCYEHVVRTKGMGTRTQDIYEGNLPDEPQAFDKAIWGDNPPNWKQKDER